MAPKSVNGVRLLPGTQLQLTYNRKMKFEEVWDSLQKRPVEIRVTENSTSELRVRIDLPAGMYFYTLVPGQEGYSKYRIDHRSPGYGETTLHRKKGESVRVWLDPAATIHDIAQLKNHPILIETDRRRVLRFYLPLRWTAIRNEVDCTQRGVSGMKDYDVVSPVSPAECALRKIVECDIIDGVVGKMGKVALLGMLLDRKVKADEKG